MDVTGPSLRNGVRDLPRYYKRDPPDTFMQVSDWGKTKNISIYLPPPPPKVAKATIQQNFQISVCEMLTEKQN